MGISGLYKHAKESGLEMEKERKKTLVINSLLESMASDYTE